MNHPTLASPYSCQAWRRIILRIIFLYSNDERVYENKMMGIFFSSFCQWLITSINAPFFKRVIIF
jgi:hypothetical protein